MKYQSIIHRQAIREADGYIELAMGFGEPWPCDAEVQARLAQRALNALGRLSGRSIKQPHVLYLTGQAYRVMHRYQEAVGPLTEAADREPANIMNWLALAWCHKRTQRLDLAIESLENALAVESGEAILHYNLACYWSLAGNAKIALRYLTQSLEMDRTFHELIADEPDFDPIRDLPEFQSLIGRLSDSQIR